MNGLYHLSDMQSFVMGKLIGDSDVEEIPRDKTTAPNVSFSQPAAPFLDQGWFTIHLQPSTL